MCVANLAREDCRKSMLHDDMILARLMVYAESIEESKLRRMYRNIKRSGASDQGQPTFKKRAQTQCEPRAPKVKFEKRSGSQNDKPTCATFGKKHYGE